MKQKQKNSREAGEKRFDVIIDYLWGRPTEALLKAITGKEFAIGESETRLVEVGESARISAEVGDYSPLLLRSGYHFVVQHLDTLHRIHFLQQTVSDCACVERTTVPTTSQRGSRTLLRASATI